MATNETTDGKDLRFYSSEAAAPNDVNRPYLEVIYSQQAKTVYFLKDHLGSIRATVQDTVGAPVRGYDDYDPWGFILAGRSLANSVLPVATRNRFTGKERDDEFGVNWDYFGARYYDAQIGRWMTRDPLASKYPEWSPYAYTLDNPSKFIDLDGKVVGRPPLSLPSTAGIQVLAAKYISTLITNLFSFRTDRNPIEHTEFLEHAKGKSLQTLLHESDNTDSKHDYSAGGPDDKFKFVKDPANPGRHIDMRHFLAVGQLGQGALGRLEANLYGLVVELFQAAKGNIDSGMNLEDFYSNYLGAEFFHSHYDPKSKLSFEQQLEN